MSDNTKMVDLPWVDGTTRTVPEGTAYESESGLVLAARDGGHSSGIDLESEFGKRFYRHHRKSAAVRIFTEAPEPPVKVNVPTGLGAIVSTRDIPDDPCLVLMEDGWHGLRSLVKYDPSVIAEDLRNGARVLFEGAQEAGDE